MKKLLLIAVAIFVCAFAYCQPSIKGIKVDGHYQTFVENMKSAGCTFYSSSDGVVALKGTFAGIYNVYFGVLYTNTTKEVRQVVVVFPDEDLWSDLVKKYDVLYDTYEKKYGKPTKTSRQFKAPYSEGDGLEMFAIQDNCCEYFDIWKVEGGVVTMDIEPHSHIGISYTNTENQAVYNAEISNEI